MKGTTMSDTDTILTTLLRTTDRLDHPQGNAWVERVKHDPSYSGSLNDWLTRDGVAPSVAAQIERDIENAKPILPNPEDHGLTDADIRSELHVYRYHALRDEATYYLAWHTAHNRAAPRTAEAVAQTIIRYHEKMMEAHWGLATRVGSDDE